MVLQQVDKKGSIKNGASWMLLFQALHVFTLRTKPTNQSICFFFLFTSFERIKMNRVNVFNAYK